MGIKDHNVQTDEATQAAIQAAQAAISAQAAQVAAAAQQSAAPAAPAYPGAAPAGVAGAVVAAPAQHAVAAPARQVNFNPALAEKKDLFPIDAVVGLSRSSPRIKAEQGEAYVEQTSLGRKFRITVESWNTRLLISAGLGPNDPGYKESIEFLRTSYDGETIYGEGVAVADYIEYLKGLGYSGAKSSSYTDIWGFVTWAEKGGDVAPENRQLHLVQASATSAGAFASFCVTKGLLITQGLAIDMSEVEIHAEARSKGTLKYTNFSFHTPAA